MKQAHEILTHAAEIVATTKENDYGEKKQNHLNIARLWWAYLKNKQECQPDPDGIKIEPNDVAMMMALMKIARTQFGTGKDDSYVDGAAYVAIAGEIAGKMGDGNK